MPFFDFSEGPINHRYPGSPIENWGPLVKNKTELIGGISEKDLLFDKVEAKLKRFLFWLRFSSLEHMNGSCKEDFEIWFGVE